ncbi:nitroreductase [Sulfitobacter sabulilitoris]|uniref:Nitroreductase n=1 Tax=Sulfitobacter sabulilitoris TaxID=2562655 RepID=A0A5S3PDA1_9RHOB|nr:nitroreductase [Sulfitobacter sabulilitoris]TMM51837.1 nitroreductase [Sulfitobacter sabulilitoris]
MTQIDTLTDILKARYSCRAFRPDPVPRDVIDRIVRTARHVPSWCNAQPWQVTVTEGAATDRFRDALQAEVATATPKFDIDGPSGYSGVYAERRRACGWQLYDAVGVQKGDRAGSGAQMMRNFALFDAPHVAIVTSPAELGPYGAMDCGGFVTAFTLAAKALGVDTVAQAAVASYSDLVRRHFGLGDDRLVLCAISFGYGDADHPANGFRTDRAAPGDIIDWAT